MLTQPAEAKIGDIRREMEDAENPTKSRHKYKKHLTTMRRAGEKFPMKDDGKILQINTPKSNLRGPWFVIYKNLSKHWALVMLHWKDPNETDFKPRLGLRWFYGIAGTPSVRGLATWLILPKEMSEIILDNLSIEADIRQKAMDALSGKVSMAELANERSIKYKF